MGYAVSRIYPWLMTDIETILRAFGEKRRLRVMRLLSLQELAVNEIMDTLRMPQSGISRHLGILQNVGLVKDRREGNALADCWAERLASGETEDGTSLSRSRR